MDQKYVYSTLKSKSLKYAITKIISKLNINESCQVKRTRRLAYVRWHKMFQTPHPHSWFIIAQNKM